jgi:hypothetical protein
MKPSIHNSVILLSSLYSNSTLNTAKLADQVFSNIGLIGSVSLTSIYNWLLPFYLIIAAPLLTIFYPSF